MTFDKFKKDTLAFVESSNVNLGRRGTKTRTAFIEALAAKFDNFWQSDLLESLTSEMYEEVEAEICTKTKKPKTKPMGDSVICIKPKDSKKGLDAGKGVHSMTPGESQRADEQLGRSPYASKKGKKDE